MVDIKAVADHYGHGQFLEAILAGVQSLGKTTDTVTIEDLAPVDEFHIGGRQATLDFISQLDLSSDDHVLDIGCGLGGTSRFVASTTNCRVSGIDLTPEFVEVGQAMCSWVGLSDRVELRQGNALDTGYEDSQFNAAILFHVGMNIEDKAALFAEAYRVIRPGGVFGVYDVMRTNDDPLVFPVPWASVAATSAVASPLDYRTALTDAGFEITHERNRRDFALDFFDTLRKRAAAAEGPPAIGLHLLMGDTRAEKISNMVKNISAGRISPVEMIARKAK